MLRFRRLSNGVALVLALGAVEPSAARGGDPPPIAPGAGGAAGADGATARLDEGRGLLLVCGDAELVSDDFSGGDKDVTGGVTRMWGGVDGFAFVHGVVRWMTGSDALRSITASNSQDSLPPVLSAGAKGVLAGLTSAVKVSVYWGKKIPASAEPARRRLDAWLRTFAASSGGKLEVGWVEMDDVGRADAAKQGIPENSIQSYGANAIVSVTDYDGLSITCDGRRETLGPTIETGEDPQAPQLSSTFEYEFSAALYELSRPRPAIVGLAREAPPSAAAAPSAEPDDRFSVLAKSVLGKSYADRFRDFVNLRTPVPADVTVLVVVAPTNWSAAQTYNLEQFLLRGGRVLLLLDPLDVRRAWGDRPMVPSGLDGWLEGVGVEVAPGVVGDLDEAHIGVASRQAGTLTAYPYFVRALRDDLNQDNPVTRRFGSVPFYFPGEILVDGPKQTAAGRRSTVLVTTSASAFVRKDLSGLARATRADVVEGGRARRVLLVGLEGAFTSMWKGKTSPDGRLPARPAVERVRGSWGGDMAHAKFSETLFLDELYIDVPAGAAWSASVRMEFTVIVKGQRIPVTVHAEYANGRVDGDALRFEKVPWKRTVPSTGQKDDLDGNPLVMRVTKEGTLAGRFEGDDGWPFTSVRRGADPAAPAPAAAPSPRSAWDAVVGQWGGEMHLAIDDGVVESLVIGIDEVGEGTYQAGSRGVYTVVNSEKQKVRVVIVGRYEGKVEGDKIVFRSTMRQSGLENAKKGKKLDDIAPGVLEVTPEDGSIRGRIGNDKDGWMTFKLSKRPS